MDPLSIYVGGLGENIEKEDLEREFSRFGKLVKIWIAHNPRGFGFVDFENENDANEAIKGMNGAVINGTKIRVDVAYSDGRHGRGGSDRFKDGHIEEFGGYWNSTPKKRRKKKKKIDSMQVNTLFHGNPLEVQKLWNDALLIHTHEDAYKFMKKFLCLETSTEKCAFESFACPTLLMAMRNVLTAPKKYTQVDPEEASLMLAKMSLDESQYLHEDGPIISKNTYDAVCAELLRPVEDFDVFFLNIYGILEEGTYLNVHSMDIVSVKYDWEKSEIVLEEQLGKYFHSCGGCIRDHKLVDDKTIWVEPKDIIMFAKDLNLFFIKLCESYKLYSSNYINCQFDSLILDEKSSKMFFDDTWLSLVKENSKQRKQHTSKNICITPNKDYVVCYNNDKVVVIQKEVNKVGFFKIVKAHKRVHYNFIKEHYSIKLSFDHYAQEFFGRCSTLINLKKKPFISRL